MYQYIALNKCCGAVSFDAARDPGSENDAGLAPAHTYIVKFIHNQGSLAL
jgi:hypothetical protein